MKHAQVDLVWQEKIMDFFKEHPASSRFNICEHFGYRGGGSALSYVNNPHPTHLATQMKILMEKGLVKEEVIRHTGESRGIHILYAANCTPEYLQEYCYEILLRESRERRRANKQKKMEEKFVPAVKPDYKTAEVDDIEQAVGNLVALIKNHCEKQVGHQLIALKTQVSDLEKELQLASHTKGNFLSRIMGNS